ncbi:unnamed protein product [Pleuronectes platessa]|uniref:Uncharacterized protein n=1 Tax=Pleuronectes platessa TaxID=8262 RepID=A0A9N7VQE2_PLEPL|nr:unnamed protein product [Pleuronectes platessa]
MVVQWVCTDASKRKVFWFTSQVGCSPSARGLFHFSQCRHIFLPQSNTGLRILGLVFSMTMFCQAVKHTRIVSPSERDTDPTLLLCPPLPPPPPPPPPRQTLLFKHSSSL